MVRILRGLEPDPERAPGPENPRSVHATKDDKATKADKNSKAATGTTTLGTNAAGQPFLFSHSKSTGTTATSTAAKPSGKSGKSGNPQARISEAAAQIRQPQTRPRSNGEPKPLPGVKTYASVEEKQEGSRRWHRVAQEAIEGAQRKQQIVDALRANHTKVSANNQTTPARLAGIERALATAELEAHRAVEQAQEATDKYHKALNQQPERYYRTDRARTLAQWQDEDANLLSQQRQAEQSVDAEKTRLREMRLKPGTTDEDLDTQTKVIRTLEAHLSGIDSRLQETFDIINAINAREAQSTSKTSPQASTQSSTTPTPKPTPKAAATTTGAPKTSKAPKGRNRNGKSRKTSPRTQRNPGQTSR